MTGDIQLVILIFTMTLALKFAPDPLGRTSLAAEAGAKNARDLKQ